MSASTQEEHKVAVLYRKGTHQEKGDGNGDDENMNVRKTVKVLLFDLKKNSWGHTTHLIPNRELMIDKITKNHQRSAW